MGDFARFDPDATAYLACCTLGPCMGASDVSDEVITVFISYSHDSDEHRASVRQLAQKLRGDGVDAWCDQFEQSPPKGWQNWMQEQIEMPDFIISVCTATYKRRFENKEQKGTGKGSKFEGRLIAQMLYDNDLENERVVPVLFSGAASSEIPLLLKDTTYYRMWDNYDDLLRRITDQPAVVPAPLGEVPYLPAIDDEDPHGPSGVVSGLTEDATYVLRTACEIALRDDAITGYVGGGEELLLEADPPLAREPCRDAIDLLVEYGYVRSQAVTGAGRKWLHFTVSATGFCEYAEAFLDDYPARRLRVIKELLAVTANDQSLFSSTLATNLEENHAFVCFVLGDLIETGEVRGNRMGSGEWSVYSPSARFKLAYRDP